MVDGCRAKAQNVIRFAVGPGAEHGYHRQSIKVPVSGNRSLNPKPYNFRVLKPRDVVLLGDTPAILGGSGRLTKLLGRLRTLISHIKLRRV